MRRILHLHSGDSLVSFIVRLRFEWRFPHEKLVGEDSQTPEVNLVIMERSLNHLWGQIVQCATHGTSPTVGGVHRPTEICDLDVSLSVEQQVLGLDISVNNLLAVAVRESVSHLVDVPR